jgi:hypothetical protein
MDEPMTHRSPRRPLRPRQYVVLLGALVILAGVAAAAVTAEVATPGACNRNVANAPSILFTVANGSALWDHLPRLGTSPELTVIDEPITVVLFEGPHQAVPLFPPLQAGNIESAPPFVFNDVVCVVTPSGEEFYYYDVDRTGLNLDGLQVDRLSP